MIGSVLAFIGGVLAAQLFSSLPAMHWVVAGAMLLLTIFRHRIVVFGVLGCIWALWAVTGGADDILAPELEGKDVTIEGVVVSLPHTFDRGVRFDVAVELAGMPGAVEFPRKVRLSWYHSTAAIKSGQRWRLRVRLKRPHGMMNPGGFDYERWLFVHRIGATGYVRPSHDNHLVEDEAGGFLPMWRQTLDDKLSATLAEHRMSGVIKALIIGDRSDITSAQWNLLQRTGTAHLMAISGLHIGLVAGMSFFVTRRLWSLTGIMRYPPPKVAALVAFSAAFLYSAIAGFSIPTRRALIMVAVVMNSFVLQRAIRPAHALIIAVFLIVFVDPLAVLAAGFWLSVLAVALILYALSGRISRDGAWYGVSRIHWVIALGLTPVLLFFFQQASVVAPIANFIAVPLVSLLIVPACLLSVPLLTVLPELGGLAFAMIGSVLQWLFAFLAWLSDLPFAQWTHTLIPLWVLLPACVGVLLLLSPRGIPGRWLGVVLLIPLVFIPSPRPERGDVWLSLLDVGQGLAAVVQTTHHVLVFDTGARYSERFDIGKTVITPFLRTRAVEKVDVLVVSHGDNDHIGGAEALHEAFEIEAVLTSVPARITWTQATLCHSGQAWDWDGVRFHVIAPGQRLFPRDNNNSCVLKVVAPGGSVLLTGDIEQAAEYRLVQQYGDALSSDVLVVPHHGSNTSSTRSFVQAVMPSYALVPAGYRNRYGFPDKKVIRRFEQAESKILNTARAGAIQIVIDAEQGIRQPVSFRQRHRRYYNRSE